jgi:hypothetical protein
MLVLYDMYVKADKGAADPCPFTPSPTPLCEVVSFLMLPLLLPLLYATQAPTNIPLLHRMHSGSFL